MEQAVLKVEGMSCDHCVKAVSEAVGALAGIGGVSVDLAGKTVSVEHDPSQTPLAAIEAAIEDIGFDVV
ncbi:MAG: copper ion binding protein [Coriobacteriaceae bacterium]|nr:copper ion binding protein [Coriobacteriaceae bacterium]